MKIQTSELIGPALDWAVGIANGWVTYPTDSIEQGKWFHTNPSIAPNGHEHNRVLCSSYRPSTDPAQGHPIIEREGISTVRLNDLYFPKGNENGQHWEAAYKAMNQVVTRYGPTALIAAMRCWVATQLGHEVEIPDELLALSN